MGIIYQLLIIKMGACCAKTPEKKKTDPIIQNDNPVQKLQNENPQNQQFAEPKKEQTQSNANDNANLNNQMNLEQQVPTQNVQVPPTPVEQSQQENNEQRREKYIRECLEYIKDVGEEGTIHNVEDNAEIVAVKEDLKF